MKNQISVPKLDVIWERMDLMTMSLLFPALFDLMLALQSIETHYMTLKNLVLLRDCEICEVLLLRYNCDKIFDSIEELKTLPRD